MDWWKVSVLPFSVVVDEAWNVKCLRYKVFVPPPIYVVHGERQRMQLAHRNQTANGCRICRDG